METDQTPSMVDISATSPSLMDMSDAVLFALPGEESFYQFFLPLYQREYLSNILWRSNNQLWNTVDFKGGHITYILTLM